jgi:SAM-dependent methyltransferase
MGLLKETVRRTLHRFGYQIVQAPGWSADRRVIEHGSYRLVSWRDADGRYDLDAYRREQEKGNRAKIEQVWTSAGNLQFIARWLQARGIAPRAILCHGTRNGFEQKVFHEFFGCEVLGTEISSTAESFPMTVRADFHEPLAGWERRADIVYSNSLDHAYEPARALKAWAGSVRDGGVLVLEKASDSDPRAASDLDPFGITLPNLTVFLMETLGDIACVRALIDVPQRRPGATYHKMMVVEINRGPPWAAGDARDEGAPEPTSGR